MKYTLIPSKPSKLETFLDPETGELYENDLNAKHYLDYYDKTHKNECKESKNPPHLGLESCINGFVTGSCVNGHNIAKIIYCGKEHCEECGKKDSPIHLRRKARWFDKVQSLDSLGYLVVTVPKRVRRHFKSNAYDIKERARIKNETGKRSVTLPSQKLMQKFSTALKRYLKEEMGYGRGMYRWHWAGDCPECKEQKNDTGCEKCNYTGAGRSWSPHLNILIEEGFMSPRELGRIKSFAKKWMNNNLNAKLRSNVVCHYQYTNEPAKKTHILSYVTRATWRYKKNFTVCNSIHDFKGTSRSWGKFDLKGEAQNDLSQLEKGICPCCTEEKKKGIKLKWGKFLGRKEAQEQILKSLKMYDGGYFRMKDTPRAEIIKPPPKFGMMPFVEYEQTANIKKLKKEIEAYYKKNPEPKEITNIERLKYLEMLFGK